MIHHKPKVIDLCCGAGGFSEGFRQGGFDIILGVDVWGDALESFRKNQKTNILKCDIRDISHLPNCDVIIGSPPCQNFSTANRKRDCTEGLKLIHEFERIVKINNPEYWCWENVEFVKNYYPSASILNSWDYGLPQRRKRAFVSNFSLFRLHYLPGQWTEPLRYSGARSDNNSVSALKHTARSGTVTSKRIRNIRTGEYLPLAEVKKLMGFPENYYFCGGITSQQKQIGNAVCPPVSKSIATGIMNELKFGD